MNYNDNPFISNQQYDNNADNNYNIINQKRIQYANDNSFNVNDMYHNLSAGEWVQAHTDVNEFFNKIRKNNKKQSSSYFIKSAIMIIVLIGIFCLFITYIMDEFESGSTGKAQVNLVFIIVFMVLFGSPIILNIINKMNEVKPDEVFKMNNAIVYSGHELMETCGLQHELFYKLPDIVRKQATSSSSIKDNFYVKTFDIGNFITKPDNEKKWYILYARIRNYAYNPYGCFITSNIILETQGNKARLLIPNNPAIMQSITAYMGFYDHEDTITYDGSNAYLNDTLDEKRKTDNDAVNEDYGYEEGEE